jgi:hypothetical protein
MVFIKTGEDRDVVIRACHSVLANQILAWQRERAQTSDNVEPLCLRGLGYELLFKMSKKILSL